MLKAQGGEVGLKSNNLHSEALRNSQHKEKELDIAGEFVY